MSNLQIICELCEIAELLVEVVNEQALLLEQSGALIENDKRETVLERYHTLLGIDEAPDD